MVFKTPIGVMKRILTNPVPPESFLVTLWHIHCVNVWTLCHGVRQGNTLNAGVPQAYLLPDGTTLCDYASAGNEFTEHSQLCVWMKNVPG